MNEQRNEKYSRQLDIVDENKLSLPIHVIGCGGIGSWTTLMLAKMGCSNITIYDFDEVEYHNTASQYFEERQIGDLKTEALRSNVYAQTNITVKIGDVDEEKNISEGIVVIAVDSMEMRIQLNEYFKDKGLLIIDGRMGGLQAEIYCQESRNYHKVLVEPKEVQREACTAKAISFNCATIASLIANYVRLYTNDQLDLNEYRERTFLFDQVLMIRPKYQEVD